MYRTERQPAWQRDVAWASAVLLALGILAGGFFFSLSQVSAPQSGPQVESSILRLTLRPGGEGGLVEVRAGAGYVPGQQLALLPGLQVYADPSEISDFTAAGAVSRAAGVLTDRLITGGSAALLSAVTNEALTRQLQLALEGPVPQLLRADIGSEMLPGGLDDGTRLADWPAQAAANPGQPVQPLVGVFVTFPAAEVRSMSDRQLGAAIVGVLADDVMQGGLQGALGRITNDNLRARLTRGVDTLARAGLHELFTALLVGSEPEMEARLAEARAALAGVPEAQAGLSGLLPAAELAGLTSEQAEERVLDALAERAWRGGSELAAAQLTRPEQVERVRVAAPLIDLFSQQAHGRFVVWSWLTGFAVLLLLLLLVAFSRGLLRLVNPGITLLIGAGLGALLLWRLDAVLPASAGLPAGAQAQGVIGTLGGLIAYAARGLPAEVIDVPLRNYVAAGGLGASLILLALVLWLLGGLRPRRRGYL
jgi:hypothetical protein